MPDFEDIADDRYRSSPFASELIAHLRPFAVFHTTVVGERLEHTIHGQAMCYLILEEAWPPTAGMMRPCCSPCRPPLCLG
jgi:hypothetical protein